ncbi:hypothetical protein LPJ53_004367 [Coemansia erecta]|uniref:DinB-like domain-containing protein n=1 Tax=Coemansia erecta TaxID=147472 RepID=A0A9W8CR00_9FUNG|nr:hypothetical protein LPJ53_004367 [Coemansia erecta]
MDTETQLIVGAVTNLTSLSQMISGLTATTYTQESAALPGSTVGKHVRHLLEHFTQLLSALPLPMPKVDYAARKRNHDIEASVQGGIDGVDDILRELDRCTDYFGSGEWTVDKAVRVVDVMPDGQEAVFMSTLGRELWFCSHHTVHHVAIITTLLHEMGISTSAGLAYAPSTVKYQDQQQQQQEQSNITNDK